MLPLLVSLAVLTAAPAKTTEVKPAPVKIAAPGLTCVNLDEKMGEFLVDSLAQQLIKQGVQVSTPKEITAVLGLERQKQLLGCSGSDCNVELAGALGVDGILTGSVAKIGAGLAINLKVISPSDGRMLSAQSMRAKDDAALLDWFDDAAAAMSKDLRVALGREAPRQKVAEVQPENPEPRQATSEATHEVEWGGRWYPARVLKTRSDEYTLIHYEGYSDSWDEWVAPNRLRKLGQKAAAPASKDIEVEWHGSWYPAHVLESKPDGSAYIHYDNYGDNWNEWVPPSRMRPRGADKKK